MKSYEHYLDQAEKALDYLRESEQEYAEYKGLVKFQSERLKASLARSMLNQVGSSVAERKAQAEASSDYDAVVAESIGIQTKYTELEAKRQRAELAIELFRSINSARSKGVIDG